MTKNFDSLLEIYNDLKKTNFLIEIFNEYDYFLNLKFRRTILKSGQIIKEFILKKDL